MATQTPLTEELLDYVRDVSLRDEEFLRKMREGTEKYPMGAAMQVMAEEGQLLEFLVKLISVNNALEIGTFTGYSAMCIARGLAENGHLITCDISTKWPKIAKRHWERAGLETVIESRVGDARKILTDLLSEAGEGCMDFVFIDADKVSYRIYYELGLELLRQGGLMVLDNTLYFGRVLDMTSEDPNAIAIHELNQLIRVDDRVDLTMLPIADGITLVRKR